MKLKNVLIVVSGDVQEETRLKPRNFGDFQRYPQSAYVPVRFNRLP